MIKSPMLAAKLKNSADIKYPVIATPKIDGFRCLHPSKDQGVTTRSLKPIAVMTNDEISDFLDEILPVGADCEYLPTCDAHGYVLCMFDLVTDTEKPYIERLQDIEKWYQNATVLQRAYIKPLPCKQLSNAQELESYMLDCLDQGFEGIMIRDPQSKYKNGRSTLKEQALIKYKYYQVKER